MDDEPYDDDAGGGGSAQTAMPPKFVLAPLNTAARKATEHFRNKYYQYQLDSHNNTFGLWIDFSDPAKQSFTLGRADTDIFLPELRSAKGASQISDLHASFQVVADTGAVLLFDHSDLGTTEPFSGTTTGHGFTVKFRNNAKSVLVARGINSRIAFGRDKWYQFEIQWRSDGLYDFPSKDEPYTVGPRNSRAKKYVQGEKVGGGAYGNVWWAMDVTDGKLMAVKKFHSLSGKNLEFATREVANLFKINKDTSIQHEHILQIIDSAGGGENDNWGEIFMPLKLGNLKTLVEKTPGIDEQSLGETVLRQMLLALQCISKHNIVHRDIKPENILWEYDADNKYHFCLGDFGLSNDPKIAKTVAGTEPFMAPEVFHRQAQTTKVDIWSLFATVVWVRNAQFRASCSQLGAPQIHAWLVHIAMSPEYASIHTMAQMNPKKRPSATRQLAILDGTVDNYGDPAATGYGADVGADPGVAADESHVGEELGTQFARAMRLHDSSNPGMSYGSGSSDMVTSPEIPYYEPYTSGIMDNYPWGESGEAGPSKDYVPPPAGDSNAPRDQRVWVAPYDNAYGPPEDPDSGGSGTAVPELWTARPLVTEEEPAHREAARRKARNKKT